MLALNVSAVVDVSRAFVARFLSRRAAASATATAARSAELMGKRGSVKA